ncbi:chaoptin-like [Contarinia nasturtii]|uniref:chaoptin-like n=1 Tax=Contarinia nasturtii TaxID=265458 RepID=UPI0012D42180|nr:chaoptin-like [Contarinia nasturtii]
MTSKLMLLVLISLCANFLVCSGKYQQIGDCNYFDSVYGNCNLTLVCTEYVRNRDLFTSGTKPICMNQHLYDEYEDGFGKSWIGKIEFENCDRPQIPRNIFELYSNVHTFNISHLSLQTIDLDGFSSVKNIFELFATHNEIAELPSDLMKLTPRLFNADFSFNRIKTINPTAFHSGLQFLNLCHNNISELSGRMTEHLNGMTHLLLCHNQINEIPSLLLHNMKMLRDLDFSFNNISKINNFAFSGEMLLERLNLSHNHLTVLEPKMFRDENLQSVLHLDLSNNLITEIKPNTFLTLTHLHTLNLSQNKLKALNADVLSPRTNNLNLLSITNNRMQELNGFTNTRIPNAKIIGISEFNCTYFNRLFQSLSWKHVDVIYKLIDCDTISEGTDFNSFDKETMSPSEEKGVANMQIRYQARENNGSGSMAQLMASWINAICLVIIVLTIFWFGFNKRLPKFGYIRNEEEQPLSIMGNH